MATALDDIIRRIAGITDRRGTIEPDEVTSRLFDVERSLVDARTKLRRALDKA
jgi:hypothetical protein